MASPLMNHFHFDGMTEYVNAILLGIAADIPQLDIHTKIYLQELSATHPSLPEKIHERNRPSNRRNLIRTL